MSDIKPRPSRYMAFKEFDAPITMIQMWCKYRPAKWRFWEKTKYYALIATGDNKLYIVDPDTDETLEKKPEVSLADTVA